MIEREIIKKKLKEYEIKEYMANVVGKTGYSHTEIQRTPLGERVIVYTSAPGLIVGSKGKTIKELTEVLKRKFGLENPQIEVSEIDRPYLNPRSVAREIVNSFERFGPKRFKFTGYKMLETVMGAGARGAEIVISGRGIPSTRSRTWRFSAGHLKKSGNVSENLVLRGQVTAHLKSGSVGVKVSILHPSVELPDDISIRKIKEPVVEEIDESKTEIKEEKRVEPVLKKKVSKKEETKKLEEKKIEKVPSASELEKKKEEEK
jgi:small subunit ribosomal protein S3